MKICTKCKQKKLLSEFHKNKNSKDKLRSECKRCFRKSVKHYRKEYHDRNRSIVEQIKSIGCFYCGYSNVRVLQLAHIDKKHLQCKFRIYIWSIDNLIKEIEKCDIACPTHHAEFDLGIISLKDKI